MEIIRDPEDPGALPGVLNGVAFRNRGAAAGVTPVQIIKKAYGNIKNISRDTRLDYQTLRKNRLKEDRIGNMTLNELWLIQRYRDFTDEELLAIATYKGRDIK